VRARSLPSPYGSRPSSTGLVEGNMDFVTALAKQYLRAAKRTIPLEDLIAAGRQGLVAAAPRFQGNREAEFTTFAWARVRGAILDAIDHERPRARFHAALRRAVEDFGETTPKTPLEKLSPRASDQEMLRDAEDLAIQIAARIFVALCGGLREVGRGSARRAPAARRGHQVRNLPGGQAAEPDRGALLQGPADGRDRRRARHQPREGAALAARGAREAREAARGRRDLGQAFGDVTS